MTKLSMASIGEALARIRGAPDSTIITVDPEDIDPGEATWEVADRPCCHGGGYVRRDVPVGHPDFGTLVECPCGLVLGRRASRLWGRAMIPVEYENLTLESYPDQTIAQRVRGWYAGSRHPWLLLVGEFGSGKTALATGVVRLALDDSVSAVFRVVPDLLTEIRATYNAEASTSEIDLLAALKAVELLVLDDIGAERMSGWVEEKLFEILNYRHNEHRRTVLTTNLPADALMRHVGERIFWRIKAMSERIAVSGNLRLSRPS